MLEANPGRARRLQVPKLLRVMLVFLLLSGVAGAATYRCQDSSGAVIFTDDPSLVPGGCQELETPPGENLNVVPLPVPSGAATQAREAIRAREKQQAQTKRQDQKWLDRANEIAKAYVQARRQRYYPPRRTQANISEGLKGMAQAAKDKQGLLQEMADAGAETGISQKVKQILQEVAAP